MNDIQKMMETVVKLSIDRSSQVLSKTLRCGAKIQVEKISMVDITKATEQVMEQDQEEMIGAMITLEGQILCKFLFTIKIKDAFTFTDLVLRREPGTTKKVDLYTESTIQEIGNILSSCVSNVFSKDFNVDVWPSPPTMINDFLGTIFSTFVIEGARSEDIIWLIETKFFVVKTQVECQMFLIPEIGKMKIEGL